MKKFILFVDDDITVLKALKMAFKSWLEEWDMSFVLGGSEATKLANFRHVDVLISDIVMPQMDGVELFQYFKTNHPDTVRVFFSGKIEQEKALKSVKLAHRYVSKPFEIEELKTIINDTLVHLEKVKKNDQLFQLICNMENLPSLPQLYLEIESLLKDPDVSIHQIGQAVEKDSAMSSKLLQLVNSSFFGLSRNITNPVDAISLLGLEILKALVLSIGIFSQYKATLSQISSFSMEELSEHCFMVASLAKKIAEAENCSKEIKDSSFMAGLLHDIGKLVLIQNIPEKYLPVVANKMLTKCERAALESEQLGTDHGEVGAVIFGLWGIPQPIVNAVLRHESPLEVEPAEFSVLTIVHVANALVNSGGGINGINLKYLEKISMESHIELWQEIYQEL